MGVLGRWIPLGQFSPAAAGSIYDIRPEEAPPRSHSPGSNSRPTSPSTRSWMSSQVEPCTVAVPDESTNRGPALRSPATKERRGPPHREHSLARQCRPLPCSTPISACTPGTAHEREARLENIGNLATSFVECACRPVVGEKNLVLLAPLQAGIIRSTSKGRMAVPEIRKRREVRSEA